MKEKYVVVVEETVVANVFVEANSTDEAEEIAEKMRRESKVEFTELCEDTTYEAFPYKGEKI